MRIELFPRYRKKKQLERQRELEQRKQLIDKISEYLKTHSEMQQKTLTNKSVEWLKPAQTERRKVRHMKEVWA